MMPPHEFRFALWGTVIMLVFAGAIQTLMLSFANPSIPWWLWCFIYLADVFVGFVAACCLASLP